jgi:DNA-directed RNA polymerase subunit beta'
VQQRAWQESLVAPRTAAEEHAAELRQPVEADTGDDPLGAVVHTPETVEDMGEE